MNSAQRHIVLAGGGTAGHVNPLLAVADAMRSIDPQASISVVGTAVGLEHDLVPQAGYELDTIDKVPFPRRPNRAGRSGSPTRCTFASSRVLRPVPSYAVPRKSAQRAPSLLAMPARAFCSWITIGMPMRCAAA